MAGKHQSSKMDSGKRRLKRCNADFTSSRGYRVANKFPYTVYENENKINISTSMVYHATTLYCKRTVMRGCTENICNTNSWIIGRLLPFYRKTSSQVFYRHWICPFPDDLDSYEHETHLVHCMERLVCYHALWLYQWPRGYCTHKENYIIIRVSIFERLGASNFQ